MDINKEKIIKLIKRSFFAPFILLVIGSLLSSLSWINAYYSNPNWENSINVLSKMGQVTIALAWLLFAYKFICLICHEYEKRFIRKNRKISALIISIIRRGFRIIFVLLALHIAASLVGLSAFYLDIVRKIIYVILISAIGWIILQILATIEAVSYQYTIETAHPDLRKRKALYTKVHLIRNIIAIVVIIVTVAAILMVFDSVRNIGISLLASAGFLTALIGLAAQRTLSSIFAGIQLALSQPIKIDDVIVVDNEIGTIEEITLSYVTLRLQDLRRMIVPISFFNDKPFQNWSRVASNLIGKVLLHVDYMLPIQPIREELDRILAKSIWWDKVTAVVQVSNFNKSSIELTIQVSAENPDKLSSLRMEVREKLLEFIRTHYPDCFPHRRMMGKTD